MSPKVMDLETSEIMKRAYEIYEQQGFKDNNNFINWLESERRAGEKATIRREDRTDKATIKREDNLKSLLWTALGILGLIVVILLLIYYKRYSAPDPSFKGHSDTKIMMVVMDPKPDEAVVAFGDTHFVFDRSTLTPEAMTLLDKDVQVLKENPAMRVRMAGYTSAKGSEDVNQKLSEDRANAVRNYLIQKGIVANRITVIGYGRTKPAVYEVSPDQTSSTEAKANMRVLFEIIVK